MDASASFVLGQVSVQSVWDKQQGFIWEWQK